MNNVAKLATTTNISSSHSSTVESSSPPSPLPLDLTLKTPLLSTGGGYFNAMSGFRPLPVPFCIQIRSLSCFFFFSGGVVVIGLGDAALEEFAHEPNPNDGNGAKGDDGDHLQEVDDDGDAALEEFVHEPNPNDSNGAGGDGRDHLQEGDDDSDDDPDYKMVDVIRRPWNTHDFFDAGSLDLSGYNGVRLLLVGKREIENIYTPGLCEYIIKYYAKGTNEEIKIFEVLYDEVLKNLGKIVAEDNLIFDQKEEEDDMDLVVWMYRRTYDGLITKLDMRIHGSMQLNNGLLRECMMFS
ncbi:hypothetical protein C1H46_028273 [Malus baccata]|uniref:Uncharacterized protein n=1 Tax=Malus baccata TaxID=106549 RepID=A0A540LI94_MALBA|nr:hypothetical protein C1H46_028273 [Malus baccata]